MDRRAFLSASLAGIALAGIGCIGSVRAAALSAPRGPMAPGVSPDNEVAPAAKEGLDRQDAEFTQYYYYRRPRVYVRRYWRPRYYRRYYYSRPTYYYRRFY